MKPIKKQEAKETSNKCGTCKSYKKPRKKMMGDWVVCAWNQIVGPKVMAYENYNDGSKTKATNDREGLVERFRANFKMLTDSGGL